MPPALPRAISVLLGLASLILSFPPPSIGAPAKTPPAAAVAPNRPALNAPAEAGKVRAPAAAAPQSLAPPSTAAETNVSPRGVPAQPAQPPASPLEQAPEKILATVNGVNITRGDFDRELRLKGINPAGGAITTKMIDEILDNLIYGALAEQYLASHNQLNDQLLQDQISSTRRQAIGEYFFISVGRNQKPLQQQDVDAFVAEHPDYFKDRRFYYYSAISYKQASNADISQLKSLLFSSGNFDKIAEFLSAKKITYNLFHGYQPSERIEENVLAKLKTMAPGEGAIVSTPGDDTVYVIKLFSSSADPQDPEKLRTPIMNGIYVTRATELISQVKKQMYESADIKYIDKPKATVASQPGKFYVPNASAESSSGKFYKPFGRQDSAKGKAGAASNLNVPQNYEDTAEGGKTKSDPLVRIFKNVWMFSLFIIYPAAFYHLLKISNEKYRNLRMVDPSTSDPATYRNYQIKRFSLDPAITWIIGLLLLAIIAYTSWNYFFDLNIYISSRNILITAAIALIGSLVLIFVLKKIYPYLPDLMRDSRFMFIGAVAIFHAVVLKVI